jgi:hypothetical protein
MPKDEQRRGLKTHHWRIARSLRVYRRAGLAETARVLYPKKPMDRPLTRAEKNRRAQNGLPMDAPRPLIRKSSDRKPMLDLDAMDEAAELEIARTALLEEKERSRAEHQATAPAPKPVKPPKA